MNVNVTITLGPNEYAADLKGNSTELAEAILKVVGGDKTKDTVMVNISDSGQAGNIGIPVPPVSPKQAQDE